MSQVLGHGLWVAMIQMYWCGSCNWPVACGCVGRHSLSHQHRTCLPSSHHFRPQSCLSAQSHVPNVCLLPALLFHQNSSQEHHQGSSERHFSAFPRSLRSLEKPDHFLLQIPCSWAVRTSHFLVFSPATDGFFDPSILLEVGISQFQSWLCYLLALWPSEMFSTQYLPVFLSRKRA